MEMSKEAQMALMQMQTYQQQLEQIGMQKQSLSYQKIELENALTELNASENEDVFKNLGPVLIKTTKEKMTGDLETRMKSIDSALSRMEESEKKISEAAERVQKKLEEILSEEKK